MVCATVVTISVLLVIVIDPFPGQCDVHSWYVISGRATQGLALTRLAELNKNTDEGDDARYAYGASMMQGWRKGAPRYLSLAMPCSPLAKKWRTSTSASSS